MESESRSSAEVARFAELLAPLGAALDDKVQNPPSDPMNRYSQWECLISEPLPKTGVGVDAVLDELLTVLVPNGGRVSDPGFWPFITSAPTTAPFLAATAAAIAAPVRLGIQAFNAVEERSLEWHVELFGLDRQMRGLYSSGGSSANLVALGAARQSAFEARGLNPAADGINGVPCALYASTETHHTVQRAAAVLGIGRNQVRVLPTAADLRLQPDVLAAAIDADLAAGILPIAAVANAGSTNTGTIDLLRALGDVARDRGVWFHVDGAYGLPGYLDERVRHHYDGIDLADSVIVDPHKWMGAAIGTAVTFVRDRALLQRAFTQGPADYLEGSYATDGRIESSVDNAGIPYGDFGVELTAAPRGVQVWAILREQGVDGVSARIRRDNDFATYLAHEATRHPRLESLTTPMLSIACVRYVGDGSHKAASLDAINARIHRRLIRETEFLPSTTVVRGAYVIRPCFITPRATSELVEQFLPAIVRLGDEEATTA